VQDDFALDLTRPAPAAAAEGQLAWESTITAPTEWVPYVYTDAELRQSSTRKGFSIASLVAGSVGLVTCLFWLWGAPLSAIAIVLGVCAAVIERPARVFWVPGLVTGMAGLLIAAGWLVYVLNVAPGRAT
jgi:hypothetical protein